MKIVLNDKILFKESLSNGKINEIIYSDTELYILKLIRDWESGVKSFSFETSGSTGTPKKIQLHRSILEYSCKTSLEFLDPKNNFSSTFLCINPRFIGGAMAVFRSLVAGMDLVFQNPSNKPSIPQSTDLCSMVPLQVQTLLNHNPSTLENIGTLIIGGAQLPNGVEQGLEKLKLHAFQSYGMTETASHIALRSIGNQQNYRTLGDIMIATKDDRLRIKGTVTGNKWLQTNDIVELIDTGEFNWRGRADHIINSGGVKISPEEVERVFERHLSNNLMIAALPDAQLGQKVVLLIESNRTEKIPSKAELDIHPYKYPKEVFFLPRFVYTSSNKIDRKKTLNLVNN